MVLPSDLLDLIKKYEEILSDLSKLRWSIREIIDTSRCSAWAMGITSEETWSCKEGSQSCMEGAWSC
jgi:hypothetical protein